MKILGISCFYHDSAAALIVDGEIVAAVQEERFTRIKNDPSFPLNSIRYCLGAGEIGLSELDHIVFYEKPLIKFERIIESFLHVSPFGFVPFLEAMRVWIKGKLFQKNLMLKELASEFGCELPADKMCFVEHHLSHAASAYYASPFDKAVVLTVDGVGEWTTASIGVGSEEQLTIEKEIKFPNSLGLLYSAFTSYLGFRVNSGEYKLMGLAPYGQPKYKDLILENIVDVKPDGSFRLNQKYFGYLSSSKMFSAALEKLFEKPALPLDSTNYDKGYLDIAASIQAVFNEILVRITKDLNQKYPDIEALCIAGGCGLNCVTNGILKKESKFRNIYVQPAAGDAGGAIGAALYVWHQELGNPKNILKNDSMNGSFLGPSFGKEKIQSVLDEVGADYEARDEDSLDEFVAEELSKGKIFGWFQGRMEFGPRALGARSIIADPRQNNIQRELNLKIKFRESFRPFAPAILAEELDNWFETAEPNQYMLFVSKLKSNKRLDLPESFYNWSMEAKQSFKKSEIPGVTHVDFSARVQTVDKAVNPRFHKLLRRFFAKTGCPILINTSFNVRGEPIVCTPKDAYECFLNTHLDYLVMENFLISKGALENTINKINQKTFNLD